LFHGASQSERRCACGAYLSARPALKASPTFSPTRR
jgi:hypothetical protein